MKYVMNFADLIWEILILQFFWVVFIFRGVIVLGIFPSTAAVFAVMRQWLLKRDYGRTKTIFKMYYKENFKMANLFGWSLSWVTVIIILNYTYVPVYEYPFMRLIIFSLLIFLTVFVTLFWAFLFPTLVHFDMKSFISYGTAMIKLGVSSVAGLIMQVLFFGIYMMIMYYLPQLIVLVGIIPLAFMQMAVTLNIFRKATMSPDYQG